LAGNQYILLEICFSAIETQRFWEDSPFATATLGKIKAGKIKAGKIKVGKIKAGKIKAGKIKAQPIDLGKTLPAPQYL
jgi:hypothetical protein